MATKKPNGLTDNASWLQVINLLSDLVVYNHYDFDEFLKKLIKVVIEVIPTDSCLIYFYDQDKSELILIGSKKPHKEQLGKIILRKGEGITGWVAEHKQTVAIEKEAYKDPRFKFFEDLPEDTYESFLSVPIVNQAGVVGVVNLQNRKPYKFSKIEIKTIESLVKLIASAFVKVVLKRQVDRLENQLEERKVIEKAKGLLMKYKNLDEATTYKFLRQESMNRRKSMKEVAESILLVYEALGKYP
ncbi:ANTAR domain-containing protein [Candidatus Curtissbacteria bacterium]|nr:ANTAR domain-containing protein [Candidatus Curtissbacteria bacterium]